MTKKIYAYEGCKACNGEGTVYDSVPYGATNVLMPSVCECCVDRAFEDGLLTEEELESGEYELVSCPGEIYPL
ncbi:MAG: hypothetical protein WC449_05115 [Candidatus Paceibacterota bacterium]